MFVFPYHKYLGPGNKLNQGEPLDIDDYLAYLHDKEYEKQIIHNSDKHFSQDFLSEYIQSGNIHSLIGYLGLKTKYEIEKFTGQIYPTMPRRPGAKTTGELSRGQREYSERQRQLGRDYQQAQQRGFAGNWHDWLRGNRDYTSQVPPLEVVTPFSPTRTPTRSTTAPPSQLEQPGGASGSSRNLFGAGDYLDDTDMEGLQRIFEQSFNENMIVDPTENKIQGSGGTTTAPLSNMEVANKKLNIPKSIGLKTLTLNFRKSRIFYSYGYAFQGIINKVDNGGKDMGDRAYLTTPLAALPVDMVGFYMNYTEANMLWGNAFIKQVNVSVVPQGIRTAFDYGSTLSGTATSEHCTIGCSAIGLNTKMYSVHAGYDSAADKPMIPTAVKAISNDDLIRKYYGVEKDYENMSMHLGVPRHSDMYFIVQNNTGRVPEAAGNPDAKNYQTNPYGWPKLDNFYSRWNFVPKIGEQIIDYKYTPVNGLLQWKRHYIPYSAQDGDTAFAYETPLVQRKIKNSINKETVITAATPSLNTGTLTNNNYWVGTKILNQLTNSIDPTKVYHNKGIPTRKHGIPLVYMGIFPIPALNPATDQTNFQNSCAYWSVVADMVLEISPDSLLVNGKEIVSGPDDVFLRLENSSATSVNYADFDPMNLVTYGN